MLKWLEVTKSTIQLTTYASYQGMVEHIIVPYFRKHSIKLVELKATDLQDSTPSSWSGSSQTP